MSDKQRFTKLGLLSDNVLVFMSHSCPLEECAKTTITGFANMREFNVSMSAKQRRFKHHLHLCRTRFLVQYSCKSLKLVVLLQTPLWVSFEFQEITSVNIDKTYWCFYRNIHNSARYHSANSAHFQHLRCKYIWYNMYDFASGNRWKVLNIKAKQSLDC